MRPLEFNGLCLTYVPYSLLRETHGNQTATLLLLYTTTTSSCFARVSSPRVNVMCLLRRRWLASHNLEKEQNLWLTTKQRKRDNMGHTHAHNVSRLIIGMSSQQNWILWVPSTCDGKMYIIMPVQYNNVSTQQSINISFDVSMHMKIQKKPCGYH